MPIPSFSQPWGHQKADYPRIYVLEIRERSAEPSDEPLAWLIVEREETYKRDDRDGSIYQASIRLTYERISTRQSRDQANKGTFAGGYRRGINGESSVSLISEHMYGGALFLDLPGLEGHRIGSFLMSEVVRWVKQWPSADVISVNLNANQAHEGNKIRRNLFYQNLGLKFSFADASEESGRSLPMKAGDLISVTSWEGNIRILTVHDYLDRLLSSRESLKLDLSDSLRAKKNDKEELQRARKHPLKWALTQLWYQWQPMLLPLAVVAFLGFAVWIRFKTR